MSAEGKSCCPPGSWPELALSTDESRTDNMLGVVEKLGDDLTVYTVSPPGEGSTKGIVFIYDVFGFAGARVKSVCDAVSLNGFHVCMPDVYGNAYSVNDTGGFMNPESQEILKSHTFESLEPKLDNAINHLKSKGCTTVGALGFCWGAWVVFELSATGKIQCGASCHPSTGISKMLFDKEETELAGAVKCPQILCPAGNDPDNLKEGGGIVNIVRGLGHECKTVHYPDMKHGWVIRGDASQEDVARDVKSAIKEVSEFLAKHLSSSNM